MSLTRHRTARAAAVALAAAGIAASGCGGEDDAATTTLPEGPVSDEFGNSYDDVLEADDPNKEDYKEILDQVEEAAEDSGP
jgi:hypothetical protein